ncbi:MAG: PAS domain S-box protein, partial [Methylococcaceae bacterium]
FRRNDGAIIWIRFSAKIVREKGWMEGVSEDITERKQAEDALKESDEKHKRMIANISDVIAIMDKDGTLKYKSPNIEHWFGWQPEDLVGTDGWETVHPDDLERIQKEFFTLLDKDNSEASVEYRYKCKDGSYKLIALTAVNLTNDPTISGVLMNYRDITAKKQLEAEKEKLEAQNRQLQKTESLSRMAAAIAHHFNNQLGAVIGNLEMAMDELPKGASTHQTLTKAMQSAWTAADMSGLMLTYLGQTHEKRESLDLSYSCRKILPLIETSLPGNVVMETDFPLPRPIIMANAGEIQQILTNLITNAREAIGTDKGTISLSVKTVSPAEITTVHRHPIDWQPQGKSYACLEVTDTGCGIEDKAIEQLFDPFFTDKFTGRGMGLPVVLGIVKAYKGAITVDSKPGSGSAFRIFFPVSEEAPRQPQTAENDKGVTISAPSPRKLEEGGTVLVVEDEEPLRKMAAIMLERLGFIVLEAKDGIEALDVFGKHQSEIRFVLTDLTMPRMNGWETLTALRKLAPDIPIILASGYDKAHVMAGDHAELPQVFLGKPYNLKGLRDAISQALVSRK